MSSNFLVFDPGYSNIESDSEYASDTLRSGGITVDAIFPSPLANKLFLQTSIMCAALAQSLANKGYALSDANFANLVAVLTNIQTGSEVIPAIIQVPYASSVTFNAADAVAFDLTLTGNVSSSSITGFTAGQYLLFIIAQDGVGNRTFSPPGSITGFGPICPTASSFSVQLFIVRYGGSVIVPITSMYWSTGFPNGPVVVQISSSGNVASVYTSITEEVNCSGGAITRTLYTAVGNSGKTVNINKVDNSVTNAVTVATTGGQTIDGQSSIVINAQYTSLTFQSDGANWIII